MDPHGFCVVSALFHAGDLVSTPKTLWCHKRSYVSEQRLGSCNCGFLTVAGALYILIYFALSFKPKPPSGNQQKAGKFPKFSLRIVPIRSSFSPDDLSLSSTEVLKTPTRNGTMRPRWMPFCDSEQVSVDWCDRLCSIYCGLLGVGYRYNIYIYI